MQEKYKYALPFAVALIIFIIGGGAVILRLEQRNNMLSDQLSRSPIARSNLDGADNAVKDISLNENDAAQEVERLTANASSSSAGYTLVQWCELGVARVAWDRGGVRNGFCGDRRNIFTLIDPEGKEQQVGDIFSYEHPIFAESFAVFQRDGKRYVAITTSDDFFINELFGNYTTQDIYVFELGRFDGDDAIRVIGSFKPSQTFTLWENDGRLIRDGYVAMTNEEICEGSCQGQSLNVLDLVSDKLVSSKQSNVVDEADIVRNTWWENLRYVTSTKSFVAELVSRSGTTTVTVKP